MTNVQATTIAAINAAVGYMQTLKVNNQPAYAKVSAGATKDFADTLPMGMVAVKEIESDRSALGGRVWDKITLDIITVVDYTDAATAEAQIAGIRDALASIFNQRVRLGDVLTVFDSHPIRESFAFSPPNLGETYRFYVMELQVTEEYFIPVGPGSY